MKCGKCKGLGWVCENHPGKAWGEMIDGKTTKTACCCGAGMPCECNKVVPPWNFGLTD